MGEYHKIVRKVFKDRRLRAFSTHVGISYSTLYNILRNCPDSRGSITEKIEKGFETFKKNEPQASKIKTPASLQAGESNQLGGSE